MTLVQKKLALTACVCVEILILTTVLYWIYPYVQTHLRSKVLGKTSVSTINRASVIFPENNDFLHYSLLKPLETVIETTEWLPKPAMSVYNEDGLNDRFNYQVVKPENTFRIVALGDSFTYGAYVDTAQSWPEQLEELLNQNRANCKSSNIEVLNLGVHGFDIPYIAKRYQDVGRKYDPDLIIWLESGTGFHRINEVEVPQIEACVRQYVDPQIDQQVECWQKAKDFVKNSYTEQQIDAYLHKHLRQFLDQETQRPIYFFTYLHTPENELNKLHNWVNHQSNVNIFSTLSDDRKYFFVDGHPNVKGHRDIASTIYETIQNLSCSAK